MTLEPVWTYWALKGICLRAAVAAVFCSASSVPPLWKASLGERATGVPSTIRRTPTPVAVEPPSSLSVSPALAGSVASVKLTLALALASHWKSSVEDLPPAALPAPLKLAVLTCGSTTCRSLTDMLQVWVTALMLNWKLIVLPLLLLLAHSLLVHDMAMASVKVVAATGLEILTSLRCTGTVVVPVAMATPRSCRP